MGGELWEMEEDKKCNINSVAHEDVQQKQLKCGTGTRTQKILPVFDNIYLIIFSMHTWPTETIRIGAAYV